MRRFVSVFVLLLSSIPFGVSIAGCSHNAPAQFCNGGDSGMMTAQAATITMQPIVYGISLNYAEIGQMQRPTATDCKGATVSEQAYVYGTTNMTIADVQPTTGRLCGGTWNRNTGGGIPDFTYCMPTDNSGVAYITASADGVTSNPIAIYVHPVVTGIVLGGTAPGPCSTDPTTLCATDSSQANGCSIQDDITSFSIANNVVTFLAANSFTAGESVTVAGLKVGTYLNGQTLTVLSAGLSATQFEAAFTHANVAPTADAGTATPAGVAAPPPYIGTACLSQGTTTQLVSRIYAGTGANRTNISCLAGHLQYAVQGSSSLTTISPVISVDQNGVATAELPGSVLISANLSDAASSAGFFSTCPPASITFSSTGTTGNPVVVNENTPQPLVATAVDTNGVTLTGLSLEYVSSTPSTIPVTVSSTGAVTVDPPLAGTASITAICQPPSCNTASYNQIGLFGNGLPISSNAVNVTVPGTNSTVLYMASTQSLDMTQVDFTTGVLAPPFLLPYVPNSMVISTDGRTIYMGSSDGLMVLNTLNTLTISRTDVTSPGTVLALSPNEGIVVITDPVRQITELESSAGGIISTYGAVGTSAEFSPDSQTVYITAGNQLLVYSTFTGWTSIAPATTAGTPVTGVAVTVPAVGAYFAGPTTTARSYCPLSTPTTVNGVTNEANVFYPPADSSPAITDQIAATNDGMHVLGATVTPTPTLNDLRVNIPNGNNNGAATGVACPATGTLNFSNTLTTTLLSPVKATAITGVLPTSDSSVAFITYTGTGGVLPAYAPAATGPGTTTYIKLSGAATAPVAGVISTDNTTLYVGTSGDNLVHIINRSTLTDTSTLTPNLPGASGATVPVNLLVQKPRPTT